MKKQRPEVGMDSSIKPQKISKLSRPTSSQYENNQTPLSLTQIRQTPNQPLSQLMNFTQIIDPTVRTDNLDQLTEIWNLAKENKITLSQDRDQIHVSELKASVNKAELKIERLQNSLYKQKELHKTLAKHIDEECKIQETIIERQNLVKNLRSVVQEHTVAITSGLDDCYKSQEFLTDLYNDVSFKQQKLIESLTEKLKNNVSKKTEELEDELESKTHKLLTLNTECDKTLEEMEEKTSLLNKINNELEDTKAMIENNNQRHNLETQHITETIEEMKTNVNTEREQNKLLAEQNKELELNDELLKMCEDLNVEDKGYLSQIENLEFIELGLKAQEQKLDSEFDELTNNYLAATSDKELQIAEERMKEIQDLTSVCSEVANKMKQAVSTKEKLSKLLAEADEESEKLEQISEIKGNKIVIIRTKLNDNLAENKILSASIETTNGKLMQIEKEINEKREDLETLKAKQNAIAQTEAELRAELSLTEQQLADKCEESVEILKKESDERSKSSREVENLEKEIQEKINLIAQEKKATLDLKKKTGNQQLELNKKIQDATRSVNKYQSAGHGKRFKNQNAEIKALKQTLEAEKQKQSKSKKTAAAKKKDTEKFDREKKKLNLTLDDLKNQLAAVKKQIEDLAKQVIEAETSSKAEIESHMRSDVNTTPNSILKSVTKESLRRVSKSQKVHFDLGEIAIIDSDKNLGIDKIKSQEEVPSQQNKPDLITQRPKTMEINKGAEHHYVLNPQTKRLQFVRTPAQNSQDGDTSPGVAALQASQSTQERPPSQQRKFFKLPRPDVKTMYKFFGK